MSFMRVSTIQRRFRRYDVDQICGSLERVRDLVVKNLSLTGLAVESVAPLPIGEVSQLEMIGSSGALEVPAEVMWSQLVDVRASADGMNNVYLAGLDFSRALDEMAPQILSFIEGHVIVDVDGALQGQYRRSLLSTQREEANPFSIKKISFSGMLIETSADNFVPAHSMLEVSLNDKELSFEDVVRVADVGWSVDDQGYSSVSAEHGTDGGDRPYEVWVDFEDLSIDSGLALGAFIRRELE